MSDTGMGEGAPRFARIFELRCHRFEQATQIRRCVALSLGIGEMAIDMGIDGNFARLTKALRSAEGSEKTGFFPQRKFATGVDTSLFMPYGDIACGMQLKRVNRFVGIHLDGDDAVLRFGNFELLSVGACAQLLGLWMFLFSSVNHPLWYVDSVPLVPADLQWKESTLAEQMQEALAYSSLCAR